MPLISIQHIEKSFGTHTVLKDINLTVNKGEVISLIGPSGSGKSTILRCLSRLEIIDNGEILVDGETMVKTEQGQAVYAAKDTLQRISGKMGMVFQQFNLFPHLTVMDNLTYAPRIVKGIPEAQAIDNAEKLLKKVGLLDKQNMYPSRLSGGQQQRVAIARALAMEPLIMLFDEPTSALDPELTGDVLRTIRSLAEEHMTMLIVTHEMAFAREVSDAVVFMSDGVIVEQDEPEKIFTNPQHQRTRSFLQSML
ncbi:MAG: amino acid ABC transporter ATP-binding protein [Neisseriaceae bacterium]|nr:amino acid ABC transporter ATP-binding protein [Neisseriaceae bacterium]